MSLEIKISNIRAIATATKTEQDKDGRMVQTTKLTFEASISPTDQARISNLARQPVPLFATLGTDQKCMDVLFVDTHTGEIHTHAEAPA